MDGFKDFTNLYSLSKTLRFELKPQGKTLEHIQNNGFLENDEHRAESYKEVKKIIDRYHKEFIESALSNFELKFNDEGKKDSLSEYFFYYRDKRDETQKKIFEEIQSKLRKQIADRFSKDSSQKEQFKRLFAKELIKEDLKAFVEKEEEIALIAEFDNFTTYFTGFHENRKNMYSAEDKATAIAYRLIHENLPKFIDNITVFEKVKITDVAINLEQLYSELAEILDVEKIEDIFCLDYFTKVLTQKQIDRYNAVLGGKSLDNGSKLKGLNEYINLYNQKQKEKTNRLPKLKPLYKQILSDRNAISWLPELFNSDTEVLESIEKCYQDICEHVFCKQVEGEHNLIEILLHIKDYDLDKIYLRNDLSLTNISQKMFGSWAVIQKAIETRYETENPRKTKESLEKFEERKSKFVKNRDSFSIGYLNECLELLGDILKDGEVCSKNIADYFVNLGVTKEGVNLFTQVEIQYQQVENLLRNDYPDNKKLAQEKADVESIKRLLN
ncbi:MAG: type V CRISPR-associated protein Cas12a/Cpf1 [Salinivirgaceae bacterium]|nr:type V CRISPR-associated protein Cas12a/Cpf1 [Salinivirgaceae bacterium]